MEVPIVFVAIGVGSVGLYWLAGRQADHGTGMSDQPGRDGYDHD